MTDPSDRYTAERITWVHTWVPDKLFSFRTTRAPGYRFVPGQFARLGVRPSPDADIVWRGYSMVSASYDEHLEFFSIVVEGGQFTSALRHLKPGDTVYVERIAYGFLTTERFAHGIETDRSLWMLSSGTGIAPFLSLLRDPALWDDYQRLILVHSVREPNELAYADTLRHWSQDPLFADWLRERPDQLVYLPVVTRDTSFRGLNARITTLIEQGRLEAAAGARLDPENACAMICGNPEMVADLRAMLQARGFRVPRRGNSGNLAVENYW